MRCRLIWPSIGVHPPTVLMFSMVGLMILVHSNIQTITLVIWLHWHARAFGCYYVVQALALLCQYRVILGANPRIMQHLQWRIQAVWEPVILVWVPKLWHPGKVFYPFFLKIFLKHPQRRVFRYSIYVI